MHRSDHPCDSQSALDKVIGLAIILLALFSPEWALGADPTEQFRAKIEATKDPFEQAKLYRDLGEQYISQDKTDQAADAFIKALSLARDRFSAMDRVRMAIHLSWADRLQESAKELRLVLAANPNNIAGRTHLARVLSWSGELAEAINQADMVLKASPDHKEALLVKADALQWQGRYKEAMPIYQRLLGTESEFDARIGLAYAHLSSGNRVGAQESARLLKPVNVRQERALKKLTEAMDRELSPRLEARYNFYRDSDDNKLHRYVLLYNFWIRNVNLEGNFRHTNARGDTKPNSPGGTRSNRAEDFSLKAYSNVTDTIGVGAAIGFTQLHDRHTSNFPTGQFKVDAKVFNGTVGANVTREVLSDTAELIGNAIRMTNVGLYISHPLTERLSINAGYNYKDFSDHNHANDLRIATQYALYLDPKITIGHRFRLLDFSQQSHSGYFDPNDYVANRLFGSYYIEREKFYTYLEAFVGHQKFRRDREKTSEFVKGGAGSIGVKPLRNLAIEVNVEGGNFAAGTTSGFSYFIVGPRLLYRF